MPGEIEYVTESFTSTELEHTPGRIGRFRESFTFGAVDPSSELASVKSSFGKP